MIIKNVCYKGTRILFGDTAKSKRILLNKMIDILENDEKNIEDEISD